MATMNARIGVAHSRFLLIVMLLGVLVLAGCASTASAPTGNEPILTPSVNIPPLGGRIDAPTAPRGIATISVSELPPEGRHVLQLIEAGGPFPYSQDGTVFQNREKLLPKESSGYYHEYTVPTPGSDDRGARRIIAGKQGERYYTDDHYDSFRWITP
jgi:ribonuclease T1